MNDYKFSHHKAKDHEFVTKGLRGYFEYRDLGIEESTAGDFVAHVIRAKEGDNATGEWHQHDCTFQMVYIVAGWMEFEYEGQGVHRLEKGDCVFQRPKIAHREIRHSEDLELVEIVAPADFATKSIEPPA